MMCGEISPLPPSRPLLRSRTDQVHVFSAFARRHRPDMNLVHVSDDLSYAPYEFKINTKNLKGPRRQKKEGMWTFYGIKPFFSLSAATFMSKKTKQTIKVNTGDIN